MSQYDNTSCPLRFYALRNGCTGRIVGQVGFCLEGVGVVVLFQYVFS